MKERVAIYVNWKAKGEGHAVLDRKRATQKRRCARGFFRPI